ncbi:MAG: YfhO family protein [Ruminococcus sp.]|nr:YfhO family protein [Ruminococcus sp.]
MKLHFRNHTKGLCCVLCAFTATALLYLIYFAIFGFYPLGERSVVWCDMEQQYTPLLMELRDILLNNGSVLLGRGGGGLNFWSVFLFFVSSPVNLLALFAQEEKMIVFVNIITVVKLSLASASVSYYFRKTFAEMPAHFNIILSVTYSFSGYAMMYYQNNMWLDMMIIFPLLMLSLFRLCKTGKWQTYYLTLCITMFLNFYISYMVVIFVVIAFPVLLTLCTEKKLRKAVSFNFILADVLGALTTAFVWLPSAKQFTSSGRGDSSISFFLSGSFFSDMGDKSAQLCCTSVIIASFVIMLTGRKLFCKDKPAFFALMTIILTVGAFISPINKIWHTGSYQAYPLRFGYMIMLMALSVCAVLLSTEKSPEKNHKKYRLAVFAVVVYATAVIPAIINYKKLSSYTDTLWVDDSDAVVFTIYGLLGAFVYGLLIILYRRRNISGRFAPFAMSIVLVLETLFSFSVYFGNVTDITARFNRTVHLSDKIDDDSFYRVKAVKKYFHSNMLEGMGYNSIGHYTSLTDCNFLFASKRLGYSAYWLDISSNGGTVITDAFLMNKYLIGSDVDMNCLSEKYYSGVNPGIHLNNAVCEGPVISSVAPEELSLSDGTERMDATLLMAEKLFGVTDLAQEIQPYATENVTVTEKDGITEFTIDEDATEGSVSYSFFLSGNSILYFDIFGNYSTDLTESYSKAVDVLVNGKAVETDYPFKRANGILELGCFTDKYVSVKLRIKKDFSASSFGLYSLDADKASEGINSAETGNISLEGNKITVTAESNGNQWVYIPFAFSEGFSAELNGSETEIHRTLGSFMAVKLDEGENRLVLTYRPPLFIAGVLISFAGLALTALCCVLYRRKIRIPHIIEKYSYRGVIFAGTALFAVIYILAPVLWLIL